MSEWRGRGYKLHLVFTALDSPDLALQRVAFRVALGGHDVPEAVVRQRWAAGLRSLFDVYLPIVDRYSMQTGGTDFSGWPPRLALQRLGRVESSSTPLPRSTTSGSPSPRRRSTSRSAARVIFAMMSPNTGDIHSDSSSPSAACAVSVTVPRLPEVAPSSCARGPRSVLGRLDLRQTLGGEVPANPSTANTVSRVTSQFVPSLATRPRMASVGRQG
jgi:hypothetical protein